MKTLEVKIDGSHNEHLYFRPLQRSIRGRFDLNRIAEPMARLKSAKLPEPIPSQRLGIEPDGTGYVTEPLHEAKYAPIKEKILKAGMQLEPALQTFDDIDRASWLFWIKRAVESGLAKVVAGKLPDKIDGKPKMNFIVNEPGPSSTDRLTAAIQEQTALFRKLLERLGEG